MDQMNWHASNDFILRICLLFTMLAWASEAVLRPSTSHVLMAAYVILAASSAAAMR